MIAGSWKTPLAAALRARGPSFILVGLVTTAVYVAVMALAVDGLGQGPVVGAIAAFLIANLVSFAGNTRFTFKAGWSAARAGRFMLVTLAGFGLNTAIAAMLGALGAHYLIIVAAIVAVVPACNFLGHHYWTYRDDRMADAASLTPTSPATTSIGSDNHP